MADKSFYVDCFDSSFDEKWQTRVCMEIVIMFSKKAVSTAVNFCMISGN